MADFVICRVCGRPLYDPISMRLGVGPVCGSDISRAKGRVNKVKAVFGSSAISDTPHSTKIINGRVFVPCKECGGPIEFLTSCQSAWCVELRMETKDNQSAN